MPDSGSILALADDLTGALETGAKFAEHNLPALVVTELNALSFNRLKDPVLVIDTETRHLTAAEAATRVRDAVCMAIGFRPNLIYKKTDSTLRGNIGSELRALADIFSVQRPVYAPAYPDMGRTVKAGELYVWGTRVNETEFAKDALNPISDSRIHSVLSGMNALVLDGESNADVDAAVHTMFAEPAPHLCAGSAALAEALARHLQAGVRSYRRLPKISRCLVVNGSRHPVSMQQMQWAEDHGLFNASWMRLDEQVEDTGIARAVRTGERVRQILQSSDIDALIVFGGDSAFGVHHALGSHPFHPLGEIATGVPVSNSGGLLWVTKAGGFGAPIF